MPPTVAAMTVKRADDMTLVVRLAGHYTFGTELPAEDTLDHELTSPYHGICVLNDGIEAWDSALLVLLMKLKKACDDQGVAIDISGIPEGAQKLVQLASQSTGQKRTKGKVAPPSPLTRIGDAALTQWSAMPAVLSFLGEATISFGRLLTGRARYRRAELWLIIQQCGPQALGIVTTISVLVGSILAFVGAIQLKMFGAEIYVANLVGLGMVVEMGALMTGIILAGRTGAAFAAQLGTMQVNEEIDALKTMGIPPMDYLVLPRMISLALMTPLLVAYADILGILGGAAVGIWLLKIPATLFFNQAFSTMTLWHCAQGLIKGSTFGILIAFAGCWRGMQCGRSASAVGDAATSAVVTGIVLIVVADTIWTLLFMVIG